ncbi:MAG: hypothetical protein N5P05_001860 [Chroococcopsis gigantea SAG 12.99]|nr:hypothetical protein [Chroococcopsis gigantea SAG 12.99]
MLNVSTQFPTLIITGMHRSGTSLTASLLQSAGVNIGEELMSADQGNLKGYFENMDFVGFHEKILIEQGIAKEGWTLDKKVSVPEHFIPQAKDLIENNQSRPAWGWKDPRTTLFLDFWAQLLPSAKFIFIHRSPWEVIDSLYRRGSLGDEIFVDSPEFAIELWASYNRIILDFYQSHQDRCLLFNLDTISPRPEFLLQSIKNKFGLDLTKFDNLYDESLITRSISWHRIALIKQHFPEVFRLNAELNEKSDIPYQMVLHANTEQKLEDYRIGDKGWIFRDWVNTRVLEREIRQCRRELSNITGALAKCQNGAVENNSEAHQYLHKLNNISCFIKKSYSIFYKTHLELVTQNNLLIDERGELEKSNQDLPISETELKACQLHIDYLEKEIKENQSKYNFPDSLTCLRPEELPESHYTNSNRPEEVGRLTTLSKAWFKIKKFMTMK